MKTRLISVILTVLAGGLLSSCAGTSMHADDDGWKDMSGSFEGWRQVGTANWRLENGEFVADSGNGQLMTQKIYDDVQLRLEFWAGEASNSGVFVNISDPDNISDTTAYEINIYDSRPDQTYRTGGLVNYVAPAAIINSEGHWNTFDITLQGDRILVVLNGVTTVDTHDSTYKKGPISLQYGAGVLKFRNLQFREL